VQANYVCVKMGYTVDTNSGLVQCEVLRYPQSKRKSKISFQLCYKAAYRLHLHSSSSTNFTFSKN